MVRRTILKTAALGALVVPQTAAAAPSERLTYVENRHTATQGSLRDFLGGDVGWRAVELRISRALGVWGVAGRKSDHECGFVVRALVESCIADHLTSIGSTDTSHHHLGLVTTLAADSNGRVSHVRVDVVDRSVGVVLFSSALLVF